MENESKDKKGGERKGVGRPRTTVKGYSFRAPADAARVLDAVEGRTSFICEAVMELAAKRGL